MDANHDALPRRLHYARAHSMCGRYTLIADMADLEERFQFDGAHLPHAPRYNICSHPNGANRNKRRW